MNWLTKTDVNYIIQYRIINNQLEIYCSKTVDSPVVDYVLLEHDIDECLLKQITTCYEYDEIVPTYRTWFGKIYNKILGLSLTIKVKRQVNVSILNNCCTIIPCLDNARFVKQLEHYRYSLKSRKYQKPVKRAKVLPFKCR